VNIHRQLFGLQQRREIKAMRRALAVYEAERAHGNAAAASAICTYADNLARAERGQAVR
jgi:hypothetical protein